MTAPSPRGPRSHPPDIASQFDAPPTPSTSWTQASETTPERHLLISSTAECQRPGDALQH